jgi:hypothetical protein
MTSIAVTGEAITMNTVMRISWMIGRCCRADESSIEAISTQPAPSVLPIDGPCIRMKNVGSRSKPIEPVTVTSPPMISRIAAGSAAHRGNSTVLMAR